MPPAPMRPMPSAHMMPAGKAAAMKSAMEAAESAAVETAMKAATAAAMTATVAAADFGDQPIGCVFGGQRRRARIDQRQRLRALRRCGDQHQRGRRCNADEGNKQSSWICKHDEASLKFCVHRPA